MTSTIKNSISVSRNDRMAGLDAIFLHIEAPDRLMNIGSCWMFEANLEFSDVLGEYQKLVTDPGFNGRFLQHPKSLFGQLFWVTDPDFALTSHVHEIVQPEGQQSEAHLRAIIAELASRPMDRSHPLWHGYLIRNLSFPLHAPSADPSEEGSAVICRSAVVTFLHHAITDGQGAIHAALSMTKSSASLSNRTNSNQSSSSSLSSSISNSTRIPPDASSSSSSSSSSFSSSILIPLLSSAWRVLLFIWGLLRMLLTLLSILLSRKSTFTAPLPSLAKAVAWSPPIALSAVKRLKDRMGCTVNDVLVTTLCVALRLHLESRGLLPRAEQDLLVGIPVSVRRPDDTSLGNKVSIVNLHLPIRVTDPLRCLRTVQARMALLKTAPDVPFGALWFRLTGRMPAWLISQRVVAWFLAKYHAVFTNVPGPSAPLVFAGQQVAGYVPIIPGFTPGALGLAILTYAEKVIISIQCDQPQDGAQSVAADISDVHFHRAFQQLLSAIESN